MTRPVERTLDCHTHYVSPLAIRAAREHPERYGVRIEQTMEGGERPLLAGEPPRRPFTSELTSLDGRAERSPEVTVQLTSPWMDVSGYRLPFEEGERWCRLLNDSLAEDLKGARGPLQFAGMAAVPMQEPTAAARELERCVTAHGFRGAMIGTNIAGALLDEPRYDPFWQQAQALRVAIALHPYAVLAGDRLPRYYLENALGNPTDTTIAAASLIFGGVLDRFPELQVLLVHGGGFLPYQWGRLDRARDVRAETAVHGAGMPRDYLRRFLYDSIVFSPNALRYLIDLVGVDRVVLGSDYPFDMGDDPLLILQQARLDQNLERHLRQAAAIGL